MAGPARGKSFRGKGLYISILVLSPTGGQFIIDRIIAGEGDRVRGFVSIAIGAVACSAILTYVVVVVGLSLWFLALTLVVISVSLLGFFALYGLAEIFSNAGYLREAMRILIVPPLPFLVLWAWATTDLLYLGALIVLYLIAAVVYRHVRSRIPEAEMDEPSVAEALLDRTDWRIRAQGYIYLAYGTVATLFILSIGALWQFVLSFIALLMIGGIWLVVFHNLRTLRRDVRVTILPHLGMMMIPVMPLVTALCGRSQACSIGYGLIAITLGSVSVVTTARAREFKLLLSSILIIAMGIVYLGLLVALFRIRL